MLNRPINAVHNLVCSQSVRSTLVPKIKQFPRIKNGLYEPDRTAFGVIRKPFASNVFGTPL